MSRASWPPDELLVKAAKALEPYLGREATAREAREFLLQMRRYFHLLREGEEQEQSAQRPHETS